MLAAETCAESWCATAPATPADICGSGPSGRTVSGPGTDAGNNPCCAQACCERTSVQPPKSIRKISHRPASRPRRCERLHSLSRFALFSISTVPQLCGGQMSCLDFQPPAISGSGNARPAVISMVRRPSRQKEHEAPTRTAASWRPDPKVRFEFCFVSLKGFVLFVQIEFQIGRIHGVKSLP